MFDSCDVGGKSMKRIFSIMKNKYFKIIFWTSLLVLALVLAFRVPTRLVVRDINQNSNLPVDILARGRDVDWSSYEIEPGFGVTLFYDTEPDGSELRFDVSMWPDAIFGKQRVDYVVCSKDTISVYGISVGDALSQAEKTLRKHGFIQTRNSDEYRLECRKFGVIISCFPDAKAGFIQSISIRVMGTNIFGIVY